MSAIDKMRVVRRQTMNGTEDRLEEYASHAKNMGDLEVGFPVNNETNPVSLLSEARVTLFCQSFRFCNGILVRCTLRLNETTIFTLNYHLCCSTFQEENSDLNKLLYKLRTISTWKKAGMRTCYSKKEGALRDQLVKSEREKLELQLKHEQDLVNLRQDNEAKKTAALSTEREIKALKKYVFICLLSDFRHGCLRTSLIVTYLMLQKTVLNVSILFKFITGNWMTRKENQNAG